MNSEDVKVVFGLEPSGLFEKVILAPGIGIPRTFPPLEPADDMPEFEVTGESGLEVTGSGLFGVAGASFFGIFGTLTFGIVIVNWPIAGSAKNKPTATATIRISVDDLFIKFSSQK